VLNLVFRMLDLDVFTGRFLTVAALTLAITVALATASYHLFEKQVLKAKNARFVVRTEHAPAAARGVTSS
jgi:peptidoglycan/LPS O-acetylase OafA/YrhL